MKRSPATRIGVIAAVLAAALASSCAPDGPDAYNATTPPAADTETGNAQAPPAATAVQATHVVTIVDDAAFGSFTPAELIVNNGDVVRFLNNSSYPHNVAFDLDDASDLFAPGSVIEVIAQGSGVVTYVCTVHPGMNAKFIVEP